MIGTVVAGRYTVLKVISRGGLSRVYLALPAGSKEPVAIKILLEDDDIDNHAELISRFHREAATLSRLSHPNTVRVLDHGKDPGFHWLVMEFVADTTLQQRLREGALSPAQAVEVIEQVCCSLEEAHQLGLIHRDLKPTNIFVSTRAQEGVRVKLMDFGIAKDIEDCTGVTRQGALVGTPGYMAPEQVMGDTVDARTDVYALGVLLYRMLLGRTPFSHLTGPAVLVAPLRADPPPFNTIEPNHGLPDTLEWTVMRCLERAPSARFADVTELRRALRVCRYSLAHPTASLPVSLVRGRVEAPDHVLEGFSTQSTIQRAPILGGAGSLSSRASAPWRDRRVLAAAGLALLVVLVGAGWAALHRGRATPSRVDETPVVASPAPVGVPASAPAVKAESSAPDAGPVTLAGLTVRVVDAGLLVSGRTSGPTAPPIGYVLDGANGRPRYVVKFAGVKSDGTLARTPVNSPLVTGVTVTELGEQLIVTVVAGPEARWAPPSFHPKEAGFEVLITPQAP